MKRVTGRSDDMLIIRGVNVYPSQVESVLMKNEVLSPFYQIEVFRQSNLDTMVVNVEASPPLAAHGEEAMNRVAASAMKDTAPNVRIFPSFTTRSTWRMPTNSAPPVDYPTDATRRWTSTAM